MKVYVVKAYLNDYPEKGGRYFWGIAAIFDSKEKAEKYCRPLCLFEDYETDEREWYYEWGEYEVE